MADIKNIDVFQTVTSVSFEVEPNTNIININKVTTSGYSGVPNLQEVTDIGAITTNPVTVTSAVSAITGNSTEQVGVYGTSVSGTGIAGTSIDDLGVYGSSTNAIGGVFNTVNGTTIVEFQTNSVLKASIDKDGDITANSFIKSGGTGLNALLDNGSTVALSTIGGATNLSPTQTATNFTINSDTGTDATIPLGNGTLAGATLNNYTTTEKNKLAAITGTNTGDQDLQSVTDIYATTTNPISVNVTGVDTGVDVFSPNGIGVQGYSNTHIGVQGYAGTGIGVNGYSETGIGGSFDTDSISANIANFKKSGVTKAFINNAGELTAQKLIKQGGTSTQFLMADGSVSTGSGGGISNATASGTDTYTATISGVASYVDGAAFLVRFTNGNTTVATLNINGLGAIALYRNNDGALIGGDIQNGGEMLCVYNSILTAFQCIGTSPNDIISYVTQSDSVTITKGMPVYAFGGTGDRMTVKRAYNTLDSSSAQTVGIVMSTSIAAGQKGIIITQGLLDGLSILPTSTFADGDTIYLGATAGTITNIKPYAPNHLVYLGVVTTASAGAAGRMYVKVQNGYELDELHNVQAQNPTLKDTLWYDNAVSPAQWKTASIPTILGYTPVQSNTAITGATNTKITYDSKGLVTAGTSLIATDIPTITQAQVTNLTTDLAAKAPLASPAFTGNPTATTQTPLNNSTRLATTAYVEAACAVVSGSGGVTVSSQDTFGTANIATVTAAQYAAFVTAGTVSATTLYFITA